MDNLNSQNNIALKAKKKRWKPKGRQVEQKNFDEIKILFKNIIIKRDELIEYLHLLQDNYGVLFDKHLVALSEITKLPLSEIYEIATFYAHFNVVKNQTSFDPIKVVRVCESLTCELFGSQKILKDLKKQNINNIKIVPGPCMGRCDVAPTVCVGKNYVDHATKEKVIETISKNNFDTNIPKYKSYQEYIKGGGYSLIKSIDQKILSKKDVIRCLNESGLKGKGGAGFPTGRKWELVLNNQGEKLKKPYNIYGGVQDNATVYGPAKEWNPHGHDPWKYLWIDAWSGGDGCVTQVDPEDPNTVYFSRQHGDGLRKDMAADTSITIGPSRKKTSKENNLRYNFVSPYFISPHDSKTLYHGANHVIKSSDRGDSWQIISGNIAESSKPEKKSWAAGAIAESELQPGLLYVGTDHGVLFGSAKIVERPGKSFLTDCPMHIFAVSSHPNSRNPGFI